MELRRMSEVVPVEAFIDKRELLRIRGEVFGSDAFKYDRR